MAASAETIFRLSYAMCYHVCTQYKLDYDTKLKEKRSHKCTCKTDAECGYCIFNEVSGLVNVAYNYRKGTGMPLDDISVLADAICKLAIARADPKNNNENFYVQQAQNALEILNGPLTH